MKINNYNLPDTLLYNKDYSWVKIDKGIATVGVIEPAAKKVKEFVFIKLPEKGKKIKQGEIYVSLEAVKWSGHLSSPISGEIIEVNDMLYDHPSTINKDSYNKGWIMKVKLSKPEEAKNLFRAKDIAKWVEEKVFKK